MDSLRSRSLTLVGGPARVGKTTLARRWAATRQVELVHLDHLLHAAVAVASGDALCALRKAPSIATHSPREWLDELRDRDAVLWTAARAYAGAATPVGQAPAEAVTAAASRSCRFTARLPRRSG